MKKVSVQFNLETGDEVTHKTLREHIKSCIPDKITSLEINTISAPKKDKKP